MNELFLVELDDALAMIEDHGGDIAAFAFEMYREPNDMARYRVTVTSGDARVQYLGGYGLEWLCEFEADIRSGIFGDMSEYD